MKNKSTFLSVKFRSIFLAATFNMFMEYLLVLSDKIIVGQFLPEAALPALTLIEPMTLIVVFVSCMLYAGASIKVSAALGRGEQETAEKQYSQALILAAGIGVLITAVYSIFSRQIVDAFAGGGPEAEYMDAYFRYARFFPVPMLLNAVVYPVALYRGGEKYCNYSALISVVGNIGLSIALVPIMGMEGISLGTFVGCCAGFFPLLFFLRSKKGRMQFRPHLSMADIRSAGVYSIANSIVYFYMAIFQICINLFLLIRFDAMSVVVFTGVINLTALFSSFSDGICEFLLSMLNMYRGEKSVIGEKNTMVASLKASILEALMVMAIILLFAEGIPSLLGITEEPVRSNFVSVMRMYAVCAPFFYVENLYVRYYLYIGKIRLSLVLSLSMNLIFPLLFSILGGLALGTTGVWLGMAAAYPLLAVCAYLLIRRQKGSDALCMFLDRDKMACQHCWNAEMTETGIRYLMDSAEAIMLDTDISRSRINKVLLAIEETQMDDLLRNNDAAHVRIECTLFLEDQITLVLHNTGVIHNAVDPNTPITEENQARYHILSGMQNKTYFLVNGTNRLIFQF